MKRRKLHVGPYAWAPRGTCRWCGNHIGKYDYWFWWLHRYHRSCRAYMDEHPKEVFEAGHIPPFGGWPRLFGGKG
jgi:hypothetical protein